MNKFFTIYGVVNFAIHISTVLYCTITKHGKKDSDTASSESSVNQSNFEESTEWERDSRESDPPYVQPSEYHWKLRKKN